MEDPLAKAKKAGQDHLVEHYKQLAATPDKQLHFAEELGRVDFDQCQQLFEQVYLESKKEKPKEEVTFKAVENVATHESLKQFAGEFDKLGFQSIVRGQVAVCIMSGGQGTRLGFDHPKGMFDLGLKSGLTLFGFFAQRLLRLNEIAAERAGVDRKCFVRWYLMTSEMNHREIQGYFKEKKYFGYDPEAVVFFPQGGIPALDYNGKILLQDSGRLCLAPGGNGAIYTEMRQKGVLRDMAENNVKYIYMGPVDNVLLKLADPTSLGCLIRNGFDIVSHYIRKRSPGEKVGVHVVANGRIKVCEYMELPEEAKQLTGGDGQLVFQHGTRASMYVTVDFIERITQDKAVMQSINKKQVCLRCRYHLAEKKIKCWDVGSGGVVKPVANNGVKFELFYFDVFEETGKIGLFETLRNQEFAPLKNAEGEDSPQSAREYLKALHRSWLLAAGVTLEGEGDVEIHPARSYNGEGLRELVEKRFGKTHLQLPVFIE